MERGPFCSNGMYHKFLVKFLTIEKVHFHSKTFHLTAGNFGIVLASFNGPQQEETKRSLKESYQSQHYLWATATTKYQDTTRVTFRVNKQERNFFLSPITIALLTIGSSFLIVSSIGIGATFSPPAVMIISETTIVNQKILTQTRNHPKYLTHKLSGNLLPLPGKRLTFDSSSNINKSILQNKCMITLRTDDYTFELN